MTNQGINVKQLASDLLAYVIDFWADATDAEPLPAIQIITGGEVRLIAWDCEQLTVALTAIDMDVPASAVGPMQTPHLAANSLRHAQFTVQLVRCAAVSQEDGEPPDPEEIHAKGLVFMRDVGLLSQALFQWCQSVTTPGNTGVLHFGGGILATGGVVVPVGPQGGYMAAEGGVTISAALLV